MKRFLDLLDVSEPALTRLLALSREVETRPIRDSLRGRVLGLVFLNPSLRTLSSFQAGMAQLGGSSFVLTPGQGTWRIETRPGVVMDGEAAEHVREAVPVLGQYADVLGVRSFAGGKDLTEDLKEPVLRAFDELSPVPLINLESAVNHPCQALADWKTLDDLDVPGQAGRFVLSWAFHPKPLPLAVPAAVLGMAARRGMEVVVLRPDEFALPREMMSRARRFAARSGGSVRETSVREDALSGAHVLYAKSWQAPSAYGDASAETELRAGLWHWCVAEDWFAPARPEAVFMHCLPVRRNVVVRDEVLDGPRSRVVVQAGNRLHVQKAVLLEMLGAG
jgi:N-acetylornithine carbamoyltransferase